ncbi:DUF4262 domain-containing protein [Mucilaginibacter pedocola]|uniref:DUF4262 domain-containing protein n=1 Tax=Mucilaginibacter pedocola TaxID=1792845 RepID=A0A1S9PBW2_9SPHI|nr:DUF4262 domain-containing protein [Mucilaginibacter pedocola]OOQ58445.1 hypothetical protein BC343_07160 [Mucilaginibacter pedocola]
MECKHDHHTDEARNNVTANIEQHGCHIVLVQSGNSVPDFAYSIGLYERFNHPEIICFDLKSDLMSSMINHACDLIEQGELLIPGKLYDGFLEGHNVQLLPVDKAFYAEHFGYARWYYGNYIDFPALQIVYPDLQGNFPWEENFNPEWKFRQPLLDRNIDFKFYEERNVGVFTTIQVLNGAPILNVYHNEDGAWQFHTNDTLDIADAKLVALETITKLDPSVNNVFDLEYGWQAFRNSIEDDWQYQLNPEEEEEESTQDTPATEKPKSILQKLGNWFK